MTDSRFNKVLAGTLTIAALSLWAKPAYDAVSSETLLNVQDSTITGLVLAPKRVSDAGNITDNITSGLLATGLMEYDGTNWDKVRGDTTYGIDVDVTRMPAIVGGVTPADALANPTTALTTNSLMSGFNGTTWDRIRSEGSNADGDAVLTLGLLSTEAYTKVFNGTTWDRARGSVNTGIILVDSSSTSSSNITTNATTAVKATAGVLNSIITNTLGTTSTVALYNIASAGCTGTPASGYAFTLPTLTTGQIVLINHTFSLGICAVTAGGAAANITVLSR